MKISKVVLSGSLILCLSVVAHAQRIGFSVGMPSAAKAPSAQPVQAHQPTLPPLPGPLPSVTANTAERLKPLDLASMHLVPPQIDLNPTVAGSPPPRILPQVPFAMDPTLGGGSISTMLDKPAMCVQGTG